MAGDFDADGHSDVVAAARASDVTLSTSGEWARAHYQFDHGAADHYRP